MTTHQEVDAILDDQMHQTKLKYIFDDLDRTHRALSYDLIGASRRGASEETLKTLEKHMKEVGYILTRVKELLR
jgi:hypothetical protein